MPKLTLKAIEDETAKIRVFHFETDARASFSPFTAGAHLEFDLGDAGKRAYSLITWPGETGYRVAVQREDDGQGGSRAMHALDVGATVEVTGPKNDFAIAEGDTPVLLVAGGIGITPMISMAGALQAQGRAFALHYAGRSAAVMGFTKRLSNTFPDHLTLHCDDTNPVNLDRLMMSQPKNTAVYICGPEGLILASRAAANAAGLADIHVELFTTPKAGTQDQSFEVEIHDTGDVFTIPADKTIIEVLEEAGMDLMFDCQRGDCGICQTTVISGTPDHRDVVLSEEERAAGSVMQICVSRSKSPRLVLDL